MQVTHRSSSENISLRWGSLDPDVRKHLEAATRSHSRVAAHNPPTAHSGYDFVGSVFAACIASLLVALYTSVLFHWGGPSVTLTLAALPAGLGMVFHVSRRGQSSQSHSFARRERIAGDALRVAVQQAQPSLTPIENAYAEVAMSLVRGKAADWQAAARGGAPGILAECNALLADYRRLEQQRETVKAQRALLASTEAELSNLMARAEAESDPVALDSLRQGVALCTDRLAVLQNAEIPAARIEAQMQAIHQAFQLLNSSLAAVQVSRSGGPISYSTTAESIARVHELAYRLSAQAQATEAATAELIQM